MRRQTDSIASTNLELLIRLLITLGQFGRCFEGIEAEVNDQVPLACVSPKMEKLGYVMGVVRERA